jgi:hypothetical protein
MGCGTQAGAGQGRSTPAEGGRGGRHQYFLSSGCHWVIVTGE